MGVAQQGMTTIATTDEDVASAMLAALELKAGFQAFMISGDLSKRLCVWQKLNVCWAGLPRPDQSVKIFITREFASCMPHQNSEIADQN